MTPEQLQTLRWLRSLPGSLEFAPSQIDAENGIIRDVVMIQEGEAKGHGIHMEGEFITDLVAYDNRVFGDRGVKGRLGHPGASDNTMGTQLAYFRNVRERKKGGKMQAIGDMHLLDSADLSPEKPNMREWVLSMSQEAPDWIMSSIVFKPGRYYQKKKEGGKKYVWEYQMVVDEEGNKTPVWQYSDPKQKVFVEFGDKGEHYFTDLVEDGAATENMFSTTANPHFFVSQAGQFLADHPELKQFAQAHPDKVQAFLAELGVNLQPTKKQTLKMSLKELLFGTSKPADDTTLSAEDVQELRTNLAKAEAAMATATSDLATAKQEITALQSGLAETATKLKKAQARIVELEAKPAALHTEGRTEGADQKGDTPVWLSSPINQKAAGLTPVRPKQ